MKKWKESKDFLRVFETTCYIFYKAIKELSFRIVAFMQTTDDANETKIKLYTQKGESFSLFPTVFKYVMMASIYYILVENASIRVMSYCMQPEETNIVEYYKLIFQPHQTNK